MLPDDIAGWATVLTPPKPLGDRTQIEVRIERAFETQPASGLFFLARIGIEHPADRFTNWNYYVPYPLYAVGSQPYSASSTSTKAEQADGSSWTPTGSVSPSTSQSVWKLLLPASPPDDGSTTAQFEHSRHTWLTSRQPEDRILLLGPYGNRFNLAANGARRNLLLIADSGRVLALLDTIHYFLDQGGRVTLLLLTNDSEHDEAHPLAGALPNTESQHTATQSTLLSAAAAHALIQTLPIQIEVRQYNLPPSDASALTQLSEDETFTELIRWADLRLLAVEPSRLAPLSFLIRQKRFQAIRAPKRSTIEPAETYDFAFVDASYLCGYGACLACTVPTAGGGVTRACLHGPIFPLDTLVSP